jgi:predicted nucleic acid-binding Zn ribbon protein
MVLGYRSRSDGEDRSVASPIGLPLAPFAAAVKLAFPTQQTPGNTAMSDDDDEDLNDWEAPNPADIDDEDSADTEPCPRCGKPIYEQAEVCSRCHNYISREEPRNRRRIPVWIIAGTVIALAVVILFWAI